MQENNGIFKGSAGRSGCVGGWAEKPEYKEETNEYKIQDKNYYNILIIY